MSENIHISSVAPDKLGNPAAPDKFGISATLEKLGAPATAEKAKKRKIKPFFMYQYEKVDERADVENFSEPAAQSGAKVRKIDLVQNPDVARFLSALEKKSQAEGYQWINRHIKDFGPHTFVVDIDNVEDMMQYKDAHPTLLFNLRPCNEIYHLNNLLNAANEVLGSTTPTEPLSPVASNEVKGPTAANGVLGSTTPTEAKAQQTQQTPSYLWLNARTNALDRKVIKAKYWPPFNQFAYLGYYFWHRVCPKLKLTSRFYFWKTGGKKRSFSRVEILGRLCRAGFEIVDERFCCGQFFVLARRVKDPILDQEPTCGPIIKLPRIGKDGNLIGVYKFRTMYSYSEYIQGYLYDHEGLQKGGKFKDDYRITRIGRFMRRTWLDELPMLANWLIKHNLKLVGVRPLSRQYFSLYTPEMQSLRTKVKPGLLPPFYYDRHTPETIEEVQQSERRYLEAYLAHPFRTDWRYFWGSIGNILFRRKHSN